jgi:predicted TIM-barrel fold metal-dependent hydrolase
MSAPRMFPRYGILRRVIDVESLVAIDVHTHVHASLRGTKLSADSPEAAVAQVFGSDALLSVPELAAYYRERRMACVAFMVDSVRWGVPVTNEEILELAAAERDTLIAFASIDPHRGPEGVALARRLIDEFDVRGFKFHPSLQHFFPDDRMAYPLYEVIAEHGLPALFHTGQTAVGSGQRGGGGILLKYSNPVHLDEVAADFPEMPIIMAHPSVPWQDEALSVALHKPQVYIDLSGWSPKYFPPQLVRYANTLLKDKVLFGTDFPALTPERWLADFDTLEIKPEVRPRILKDNAARLLGLSPA